jgi:hypothetical protein
MNEQSREPEWAPEADERSERMRRAWSIEDLRSRLGVAAPEAGPEKREASRKTETTVMTMERPRIVRRGVAPALA